MLTSLAAYRPVFRVFWPRVCGCLSHIRQVYFLLCLALCDVFFSSATNTSSVKPPMTLFCIIQRRPSPDHLEGGGSDRTKFFLLLRSIRNVAHRFGRHLLLLADASFDLICLALKGRPECQWIHPVSALNAAEDGPELWISPCVISQ